MNGASQEGKKPEEGGARNLHARLTLCVINSNGVHLGSSGGRYFILSILHPASSGTISSSPVWRFSGLRREVFSTSVLSDSAS